MKWQDFVKLNWTDRISLNWIELTGFRWIELNWQDYKDFESWILSKIPGVMVSSLVAS